MSENSTSLSLFPFLFPCAIFATLRLHEALAAARIHGGRGGLIERNTLIIVSVVLTERRQT